MSAPVASAEAVADGYLSALAAKSSNSYLDDGDVTAAERRFLAEFLTPRQNLAGRVVWPVGELLGGTADG